jgi:glycosyltransferase involved in cell wall biosynthesis
MRNVAIDAYHFVGMRGGSGGSGSYLFALIEHLSRLVDVRVIASRHNAPLFAEVVQRHKHLVVAAGGDGHAEAVRAGSEDADILYAPFTSLPGSGGENRIPSVIAIHDLQHRFLKGSFPEPERVERDDDFFAAATSTDGIITFSTTEQRNITEIYNVKVAVSAIPHAPFLVEDVTKDLEDARIAPDRNPYIKKYGRYVLYSAVNWPHKNHFRLIEAFRLIAEDSASTDVKLILTGAPCVEPRQHFYKELLDQPWARERVVDLGYVSNVQLHLLLCGAEAFVFPSMYEGVRHPGARSHAGRDAGSRLRSPGHARVVSRLLRAIPQYSRLLPDRRGLNADFSRIRSAAMSLPMSASPAVSNSRRRARRARRSGSCRRLPAVSIERNKTEAARCAT